MNKNQSWDELGRLKITDLRLIFDNDVRFLNQF